MFFAAAETMVSAAKVAVAVNLSQGLRGFIVFGCLKAELNAPKDDVLVVCGHRPRSLAYDVEVRLLIIQVETDVAVEIPVETDAPRGCFFSRRLRNVRGKRVAVHRQLPNARDKFKRSPSATPKGQRARGTESIPRRGAESIFLTCQEIAALNLPRGVVEPLLIRCAGNRGFDRLRGKNVLTHHSERPPIVKELRVNSILLSERGHTWRIGKESLLSWSFIAWQGAFVVPNRPASSETKFAKRFRSGSQKWL